MIRKITTLFLLLSLTMDIEAQNQVCTSTGNELDDLNTIGKCAIEKFKSSNTKEFIQVSSRNRYVRKKKNTHLSKLKEHLKTVPEKKVNNTSALAVIKETKSTTINSLKTVTGSNEAVIKDFLRFDVVSNPPIFITCNSTNSNEAKEECNKETIIGVILENLVYPFDAAAEGIEGKVWVRFVIDKEGYVGNVTTNGPENGALLEKEAERLVKLLPKFLPGKHNKDYVNVEYFMPIDFHLD